MFPTISLIILANGIYDIICAMSIANIVRSPRISELHLSIFRTPPDRTLLATWILLNGIIRTSQYYYQTSIPINQLVQLSYFVEAFVFIMEFLLNNAVETKAIFVIVSSLLLGGLAHPK
jgi:hypothetical protein